MMVTVDFLFKKRQIPLIIDSPPRYDLPESWQESRCSFSMESRAGIEEVPGMVDVDSTGLRHIMILAPRTYIDADLPLTWPTFFILFDQYILGGPIVLTDSMSSGLNIFNGIINPPARMYFVEGEEMTKVGLWEGLRKVFFGWLY